MVGARSCGGWESEQALTPAGFNLAPRCEFQKIAGWDPEKIQKHGAPTMGIAVRDEGHKVSSNINVTPMVDVMLVLLIIFMVITPMLQNKVQIDMAKAINAVAMPDASKDDAIVVAITRDGGVFLGQNKTSDDQLGSQVQQQLADKPGKTIYIRADARAQYRAVEDAIDAVRTAGVEDVGLLVQRRDGDNLAGGE
ncbi:MAG: biopolymer transporter ExbD [Solirubrobacteraceae bacterium]